MTEAGWLVAVPVAVGAVMLLGRAAWRGALEWRAWALANPATVRAGAKYALLAVWLLALVTAPPWALAMFAIWFFTRRKA